MLQRKSRRPSLLGRVLAALAVLVVFHPALAQPSDAPLSEMDLEDLLSVSVVSASNALEALPEAPATVIVITRKEIRDRGYADLSEVLEDLPGMEIIRPFGPTYVKNYLRGFRNTIGDPFLVLLDGIVLNHLYFNTADVIATLPLSNVERVEAVYGPASSVYGANAFMGVINVITSGGPTRDGASASGWLTAGTAETRTADVTATYRQDDFSLRVTGRLDDGLLDSSHASLYEFTKNQYYADRRLWGGFVENPNLAGAFRSQRNQRSLDVRLGLGIIEAGLLYQRLSSGNGTEYTGDRAQNNAIWARPDLSGFLRVRKDVTPALVSSTLLRYRESDVSNDSYFVDSFSGEDASGKPARLVQLSYWQALNSSWSVNQDFEYHAGAKPAPLGVKPSSTNRRVSSPSFSLLALNFGFRYERKDLQKAYDINAGPAIEASQLDASTYPYPAPPSESKLNQNRIATTDAGVYAQAKVRITGPHQANLGLRYDRNSEYGGAVTLRAGYVGDFGRWGLKALYGEAFQEPNPRLLYGGWTGSGSDPMLDPERSRTVEVAGTFKTSDLSGLVSFFWVRNRDTIVNTSEGAQNIASQTVTGVDVHFQKLLEAGNIRFRLWSYLSGILDEYQKEDFSQSHRIGDLAHIKMMGGVTVELTRALTATLRGRYIGARKTVVTNPVPEVPGFATFDAALSTMNVPWQGLGLRLTVSNILDRAYVHPGVREANAGTEPGSFDETGRYSGSRGYFSSLLPQPGRTASLSLLFSY